MNLLHDSMEFQIIRRLLLQARHQALIPLLSISLACKTIKQKEEKKESKQNNKVHGRKKINDTIIEHGEIELPEINNNNPEIDSQKHVVQDKGIDVDSLSDEFQEKCTDFIEQDKSHTMTYELLQNINTHKIADNNRRVRLKNKGSIMSSLSQDLDPKVAYRQLQQNLHNNPLEKIVDKFFLDNLPDDIIDDYEKKAFTKQKNAERNILKTNTTHLMDKSKTGFMSKHKEQVWPDIVHQSDCVKDQSQ